MNEAIILSGQNLAIKNFPSPKLFSESVIINHEAFGMNYDDLKVINGKIKNPNQYGILGIEAAGTVVEVAKDCKANFKIGDRVCYATYHPGAFIKTRAVHEKYLIPIPKYANFKTAATLLKGLMSFTLLGKIFILEPKSTIVLSGASGGIGSFITQIASKAGYNVIGLTSNDSKKNFILSGGAQAVINYKKEDVTEAVMHITKGRGADFFFDCLGRDVQNFAFNCLKVRGFYIQFGNITGEAERLNITAQKQKSITTTRVSIGHFLSDYNHLTTTAIAFFKGIQSGDIRVHIQTYDFHNPKQAFLEMQNGITFGQKVLIF